MIPDSFNENNFTTSIVRPQGNIFVTRSKRHEPTCQGPSCLKLTKHDGRSGGFRLNRPKKSERPAKNGNLCQDSAKGRLCETAKNLKSKLQIGRGGVAFPFLCPVLPNNSFCGSQSEVSICCAVLETPLVQPGNQGILVQSLDLTNIASSRANLKRQKATWLPGPKREGRKPSSTRQKAKFTSNMGYFRAWKGHSVQAHKYHEGNFGPIRKTLLVKKGPKNRLSLFPYSGLIRS